MKKMLVFVTVITLLVINSCRQHNKNEWTLLSPDGKIKIKVILDTVNTPVYSVYLNNNQIVKPSKLGISLINEKYSFTEGLSFVSEKDSVIDETYTIPTGKKQIFINHGKEKQIAFKNTQGEVIKISFRAYNDGIAFKYQLSNNEQDTVKEEISYFNISPESLSWTQEYTADCENFYPKRLVDTMKMRAYMFPALFETPDHNWLLISDASVSGNYAACQITHEGTGKLKIHLPDQKPVKDKPIKDTWEEIVSKENEKIIVPEKASTPWRMLIIGNNLGTIVESTLIENLNPPCEINDTGWIKPGIAVFPWWGDYEANDKPDVIKKYVDMAAEMNWSYLEFDIGLLGNKGVYAANYWRDVAYIPAIIQYAGSKGIGVYGWDERRFLDTPEKRDDIFGQYSKWGVKGIKIDFVNSDKQESMKFREDATRQAAKYKLLVSFHGDISPRGARRTFPNIMTQEGVKGAEYYLSFSPDGKTPNPEYNCTLPFTRNIVGPMDYTPVSFSTPRRTSTYAHELALPFIYESGWVCMADKPSEFLNSPAKGLLQKLQAKWDNIHFIDGYPGEYCCLARQKNNDWFIAAINAKKDRILKINFNFLKDGEYGAKLYTDDINDKLHIEEFIVSSTDTKNFNLKSNGGFVVHLKKTDD